VPGEGWRRRAEPGLLLVRLEPPGEGAAAAAAVGLGDSSCCAGTGHGGVAAAPCCGCGRAAAARGLATLAGAAAAGSLGLRVRAPGPPQLGGAAAAAAAACGELPPWGLSAGALAGLAACHAGLRAVVLGEPLLPLLLLLLLVPGRLGRLLAGRALLGDGEVCVGKEAIVKVTGDTGWPGWRCRGGGPGAACRAGCCGDRRGCCSCCRCWQGLCCSRWREPRALLGRRPMMRAHTGLPGSPAPAPPSWGTRLACAPR
jgi:hypothetical protein